MRRVQEKLLEQISEGRRRLPLWVVLVGTAVIGGAVVWGVMHLGATVRETGAAIVAERGDPKVESMIGALDEMKSRLDQVEGADRNVWREELERLQGSVLELGSDRARLRDERARLATERDGIRAERDALREKIGALKSDLANAQDETQRLTARAEQAEKDVGRLTTKAIENQRLLTELNSVVENQRNLAASGRRIVTPEGAGGQVPLPSETKDVVENGPGAVSTASEAPPPATSDAGQVVIDSLYLEGLNAFLGNHRGSDVYRVVSAEKVEDGALKNVVLQVRGQDGSLAKTVESGSLSFGLSPRSELLELEFETGHVTFHRGGGRDLKAPFYQDRYQILVLGIDVDAAMKASYPFLRVKAP